MFRRNWAKLLGIPLLLLVSITIKAHRVRVRGYYRKDGTYVRPHYRTAPEILSLTIGALYGSNYRKYSPFSNRTYVVPS